jgi:hypothetical protein
LTDTDAHDLTLTVGCGTHHQVKSKSSSHHIDTSTER